MPLDNRSMSKPVKKLDGNFKRNLHMLKAAYHLSVEEIAKRSRKSKRSINYLLSGERTPTEEMAEAVGGAFGLNGWQMLLPNLTADLARRGKLDKLIDAYGAASDEGRDYIEMVANREAKYSA